MYSNIFSFILYCSFDLRFSFDDARCKRVKICCDHKPKHEPFFSCFGNDQ
jgi:hypothetical protein